MHILDMSAPNIPIILTKSVSKLNLLKDKPFEEEPHLMSLLFNRYSGSIGAETVV